MMSRPRTAIAWAHGRRPRVYTALPRRTVTPPGPSGAPALPTGDAAGALRRLPLPTQPHSWWTSPLFEVVRSQA